MGLLDALSQLATAAAQGNTTQPQHVDAVVNHASPDVLSQGLREAFDSKDTPSIGNLVGQMFGQSSNQQQAGMLNQIVQALGPAAAAALAGGVLGKVMRPDTQQVDPAAVGNLTPAEVTQVVDAAKAQQPDLSTQLGDFYSQHSGLIKALGGAALLAAAIKMKQISENR